MKKSTNSTRVIILSTILLSTTILCWTRYSARAAAPEVRAGEGNLNPQSTLTAPGYSAQASAGLMDAAYGRLPLSFEPNCGQTDPNVAFVSRGSGSTLFLTPTSAVLALRYSPRRAVNTANATPSRFLTAAMRMKLVGANPAARIAGRDRLSGKSNYFRGNDASKWRANVPTYAKVQYNDVYPGVNLVYHGNERRLEYDFEIAPGANPGVIRLAFEGVTKIILEADGSLVLRKPGRELRLEKPSVYQELNGARQTIAGRYVVKGRRQIVFKLGKYDRTRALVIDPVLSYSTFLGGTGFDEGRSIALDADGNAYVTGRTTSFNFPTTISGYDTTYANSYDVFVTKLNAAGSSILYSTYLGGNSEDIGYSIAIDSSGNAYVTGSTSSNDFPVTPGAFQALRNSFQSDAFVSKLNGDGTALVYSTYMGGSSFDQASGIAVDSFGNAYVAGLTSSSNFPTTAGAFQTTSGGGSDAFVTKLNDTGTAQVYSTYLGGTVTDQATAIKVDSLGNAYITGTTLSTNFDVTAGAYQTTYGGAQNFSNLGDAFATKLNATATALVYSTYIGGIGDDGGFGLDLATSGEVFLTGSASSINLPTTTGVVRVGNGGMAKSTNGAGTWTAINSGLTNSTELSLAIDPSNPNVVFAGSSGGGVFKSTNGGANWVLTNSGLTDLTIRALAIDPTATSVMYLGTDQRGVFRSTNSGATWNGINTGQNGMTVNTIKIDPAASSTIYAGTGNGIFKTTNGGASWTAQNTGLNQGSFINVLAINPVTPATIYAGLNFGGVFKSTDGGAHWGATNLTSANIRALAIDPLVSSTIYAGTGNGTQKSTDDGATWVGVNAGLTNRSVGALAISPVDPLTIYAGTGNGVFRSTDGGNAWSPGNNGLAGAVVNVLAIDPAAALTLYCGSASGSTDAFVTKLNGDGTALDYSTFLGGTNSDQGLSIAADTSGQVYVTGFTSSQNFPTTPGGFQGSGFSFDQDAFVTKLSSTATALVYSTYLGGNDFDEGFGVVANGTGNAYVTGLTVSQNFPTTAGAFQPAMSGFNTDAFISKLAVIPSLTADLGITMTGPAGPLTAGSSVSYNITVTNNGPERASLVLVNDELPPSLVFNFCNGSCTNAGNSVTFSLGSIEVGASANVTIFAIVSCAIESSVLVTNTATVASSATDLVTSNDSATTSFTATNTPLSLNPTSQAFSSGGGSNTVSVNGNAQCNWTSMSNDSWINITFSSNCCNGIVNYTVAANLDAARTGTMTIAGQTFIVNQSGAGPPPQYQGYMDGAGCNIITGWAWNANQPNSSITVNIFDGANFIATVPANQFREDVLNAGIGSGFYGFSFTVPQSLKNDQPHLMRAFFGGTNTELGGSSRQIICDGAPQVYEGYHDGAGCNTISGWAWDQNDPESPINVDIYDGTILIATIPAIMFRQDLLAAGIGNGYHGFSYTVPASLKDGQLHPIRIRFSGTQTDLGNTPRTIGCSGALPVLEGNHDTADCNEISGWAWDRNDPQSPINVAVYSDGQWIATLLAILYRQDLADAGIGNGYHAFRFSLPANLKNGQPHSISVRYSGSAVSLGNSPRSVTCP